MEIIIVIGLCMLTVCALLFSRSGADIVYRGGHTKETTSAAEPEAVPRVWEYRNSMWLVAFEGKRMVADLRKDAGGMWWLRSDPKPGALWHTVRRNLEYTYPHTLNTDQAQAWAERLLQLDNEEAKRGAASSI